MNSAKNESIEIKSTETDVTTQLPEAEIKGALTEEMQVIATKIQGVEVLPAAQILKRILDKLINWKGISYPTPQNVELKALKGKFVIYDHHERPLCFIFDDNKITIFSAAIWNFQYEQRFIPSANLTEEENALILEYLHNKNDQEAISAMLTNLKYEKITDPPPFLIPLLEKLGNISEDTLIGKGVTNQSKISVNRKPLF